jgi:hypothetical protein
MFINNLTKQKLKRFTSKTQFLKKLLPEINHKVSLSYLMSGIGYFYWMRKKKNLFNLKI